MKSTDQNVPKRNWNVGSNALSIPLGAMLIWWCSEPQVLIFRRAWRRESNVKRGSTGKVSGVTVLSGWRTALLARCRANLRCCIIYLRARSFVCDSSVAFLPYLKMQPLLRANPRCYLHFASCHSVPTALPMRALYCEYSYHERKPKSSCVFFCVFSFPTSHFPFFFHPDWTDSFGNAERPVASAGLVRPEPVAVEGVAQDLSPHKVLGTQNRTRSPLSSYQSRRVGGVLTVWTVGTGLALTLTSCSALWHPLYGVPRAAFFLRCLSFPRLPPRSV